MDQADIAVRDGHGNTGWGEGAFTGAQMHIGDGHQIGARITAVGAAWQFRIWMQLFHCERFHALNRIAASWQLHATTAKCVTVADVSATTFQRRELPPLLVIVIAAALGGSFGLIFVPIATSTAVIVAVVGAVASAAIVVATSPRIRVAGGELHAGAAHIPLRFLREPTALDQGELRATLGVNADERAFVLHRPWAKSAVLVRVDDPRDPTPYWLVCTKDPHQLVRALRDGGVQS